MWCVDGKYYFLINIFRSKMTTMMMIMTHNSVK